MYEYKFVRIEIEHGRERPKKDYQAIIYEHAQQGWRLVQIFAPTYANGAPQYFEIIFEREKPSRESN